VSGGEIRRSYDLVDARGTFACGALVLMVQEGAEVG
jgi:hypothetical protein